MTPVPCCCTRPRAPSRRVWNIEDKTGDREKHMLALILGLILFLGMHSVRLFAADWRVREIDRLGVLTWQGIYSVVSLVGLVFIIWGYGQARQTPQGPGGGPIWTRQLAALLTVPGVIL